MEKVKATEKEMTVEEKLRALYRLQLVDSEIDNIKIMRGELPLEVQDLEDEVAGLETRIAKLKEEVDTLQNSISSKNNEIVDSLAAIKKYEEQQDNVRNNREYDSLSKEIEYQTLEIELCNKKIKEFTIQKEGKSTAVAEAEASLAEMQADLDTKKSELDSIIADTRKEEENLVAESEEIQKVIEERLITAYRKIRQNARNGLGVVSVQRDACGGCFNQIPPQRQLDIRSRKKIIVCEYCGRILVDDEIIGDKEE